LLNSLIIAAIPHTEPWGLNTVLVMIICNIITIAIRGLAIALPIGKQSTNIATTNLFQQFSPTELIATFSLGHMIGVGCVLGLTNIGVI
jgi:photosystem I subunit X